MLELPFSWFRGEVCAVDQPMSIIMQPDGPINQVYRKAYLIYY